MINEMMKVAAVILTKDEEARIKDCLVHIRPWIDHILVLDSCSADNTVKIAEGYANRVVSKPFSGSFSEEKNYARTLIPKDCGWILWIDADERFDVGFLQGMKKAVRVAESADIPGVCFRFPRVNLPDAKNFPDFQIRLFRNSRDIQWVGNVHEIPYLTTEHIPLDKVDDVSRKKRLGVITVNAYPIIHLDRRKDLKRSWW